MARKTGSSSSVAIPLSTLIAKLPPSQIVKVSKGWLDAVQEAHNIDLGVDEDAPAVTPTAEASAPAASDARPAVSVE